VETDGGMEAIVLLPTLVQSVKMEMAAVVLMRSYQYDTITYCNGRSSLTELTTSPNVHCTLPRKSCTKQ